MTRNLDIGALEADVLKTVKNLGDASAGDVTEALKASKGLAYTTVSTTLDRLYRKGLVARESVAGRTGQKYVYSFPGNPNLERQVVNRVVDKLVSAFGPSVASAIYDRLSEVSPEESQRLAEGIEERRKKHDNSSDKRPSP